MHHQRVWPPDQLEHQSLDIQQLLSPVLCLLRHGLHVRIGRDSCCHVLISLICVQNWVDIGLFGALPTYLTMWCVLMHFAIGCMHVGVRYSHHQQVFRAAALQSKRAALSGSGYTWSRKRF